MTEPTITEDWFPEPSARMLERLARATNGLDGDVVEIGSWEGNSTLVLAAAVAPTYVHAVDTWEGSPSDDTGRYAAERDVYATFVANTTGRNVWRHRMDWRSYFTYLPSPMRLCFIDADHAYQEVYDNIVAAKPLIVPGGVLCGHDIGFPEVAAAVDATVPYAARDHEAMFWWWTA